MNKLLKPARLAVIFLLLAALLAVYFISLYQLQIVEGEAYYETSQNSIVTTETVRATRGDITDRYGRLLVSSRPCYSITIDRDQLLAAEEPNAVLLRLVQAAQEAGVTHNDSMPISFYPFEYAADMNDTQLSRLAAYLDYFELEPSITAARLMGFMEDHYDISRQYSDEEVRTIAGIRYELESRFITNASSYIFAQDVDVSLITVLEEGNFPGVVIVTDSVREYHTPYAAHVLGTVGAIPSDQAAEYREKGYPMDATVGRTGIELLLEDRLQGKDGTVKKTENTQGVVTGLQYTEMPQPGENVALTLDIGLQGVAEESLAQHIQQLNGERTAEGLDPAEGGAVVAVDIDSFEVLTCASYPSFSLDSYSELIGDLTSDPLQPLWNRALEGTYSPGSTFKMTTALAALQEGIISPYTEIQDKGIFTDLGPTYQPKCWIYPSSHGYINVMEAIEHSCNYFFYQMGNQLGIEKLTYYGSELGLGQPTGIELGENPGVLASVEYREEVMGEVWYGGDNLQAAIGQSDHLFTPIQLACYTATLANGGSRYEAHIIDAVYSSDYSATLEETEPLLLHQANIDEEYFDYIRRGMNLVAENTSISSYFDDYPGGVGAKTGTAQILDGGQNNAVFVCFAPYDDPEIAIAVVIEKGGSGSSIAGIVQDMLDYYFAETETESLVLGENVLIP